MKSVRVNEKLKRISTILGTGGLTLLIAGFSRSFLQKTDLVAVLWLLFALMIIWASCQINDLLQPEDEL